MKKSSYMKIKSEAWFWLTLGQRRAGSHSTVNNTAKQHAHVFVCVAVCGLGRAWREGSDTLTVSEVALDWEEELMFCYKGGF